ncbi:MAG: IS3 family transposase [Candidatus Izemoplasmatales bacterium]
MSILRKKFISHLFHICNSVDKLEKTIDEYVVFFNTQRPHASLKYNTLEK